MSTTRLITSIITAISVCLLLSHPASAEAVIIYYISASGNDTNTGTKNKPFKTIQKLNSIHLLQGTKIFLKAGATFAGPLIIEADENGSKNQLIIISSYGKGMATIDSGLKEAVIISSNFFVIKNLHLRGAGRKDGNTSSGMLIKTSGAGIISNVVTEGFQKSGIELYNCHDMLLEKVMAKNNGFCGIYVDGEKSISKNITIRNCKAENNAGDPTNLTNHSGNGIFVAGSDSLLIEYCTATNNGWDMPRKGNGPVGIWGYNCDHLTIQYCISYKNRTRQGASDGGGFDFDGGITNSVMQYCLSYENEGSGYGLFQFNGASLWSNNTIRYCISINDGRATPGTAGFLIWNESADSSGLDDCKIYNNVVYNNTVPAVRFDYKSSNSKFIFENNIFMGRDEIVSGPSSGEKFIGNIWWNIPGSNITFRGYHTIKQWSDSTGQEQLNHVVKGKQVNPMLKGPIITHLVNPYMLSTLQGFKLQPGSPLKKQGVFLDFLNENTMPVKDFFGNRVKGKQTTPGVHELNK